MKQIITLLLFLSLGACVTTKPKRQAHKHSPQNPTRQVATNSKCNKDNFREYIYREGQHHCNLRKADLHGLDLQKANLAFADLQFANLRDTNLSHADLKFANFNYAILSGANLSHADVMEARFMGIDFREVKFQGSINWDMVNVSEGFLTEEFASYIKKDNRISEFILVELYEKR